MAFPYAIVEMTEDKGKPSCAVIPTVRLIDNGDTTVRLLLAALQVLHEG